MQHHQTTLPLLRQHCTSLLLSFFYLSSFIFLLFRKMSIHSWIDVSRMTSLVFRMSFLTQLFLFFCNVISHLCFVCIVLPYIMSWTILCLITGYCALGDHECHHFYTLIFIFGFRKLFTSTSASIKINIFSRFCDYSK